MAIDKREMILLRLEALLGKVSGIATVCRDRGELEGVALPAAVLLDGKEDLVTDVGGRSLNAMPAAVFSLQAQIFIVLKPRDDASNSTLAGVAAPIGPELSSYRMAVLKAIIKDDTLVALCGSNGQVVYNGCVTDMQTGGEMTGQLQLNFSFSYALKPSEL